MSYLFKETGYTLHHEFILLSFFAKLRKATVGFVMPVRLSVRIEQLGSESEEIH